MLTKRLIACLDVRDGEVVKGVGFADLERAGDPASLASRYNEEGIDELVLLDVTATIEGRAVMSAAIRAVAERLFIPLTVGGGIRTIDDAAATFDAGADKISLNTAALREPGLISQIAGRYGSQAVVVAIDTRSTPDGPRVFSRSGTTPEGRETRDWAREVEARGAGEILLTSMDRDGTRAGFDCGLVAEVSARAAIPVIASGGAGTKEHFLEVFTTGRADAALAASVFHFSEHGVSDLKQFLSLRGVPMRLSW